MTSLVFDNCSEASFLQSSFMEFVKCWGMGQTACFHVESRNHHAHVNFSTYLGPPTQNHFYSKTRNKSSRKTSKDNLRAKEFQDRMNSNRSNQSSNDSDTIVTPETNQSKDCNQLKENALDSSDISSFSYSRSNMASDSSRFQTKRVSLPSTSPIAQKNSIVDSSPSQSTPSVSSPMASPCAKNPVPESITLDATMGSSQVLTEDNCIESHQMEINSEISNENGLLPTTPVSSPLKSQFESSIPSSVSCGNDNKEKGDIATKAASNSSEAEFEDLKKVFARILESQQESIRTCRTSRNR